MWQRVVIVVLAACIRAALADELIVRPDSFEAAKGTELGFSVISTSVFIRDGELLERRDVRAGLCGPLREVDVRLRPDPREQAWRGAAPVGQDRAMTICAHRLPEIWTNTPTGPQSGARQNANPSASFVLEEFAKAPINLDPKETRYAIPIRQRLELVPVTNPALVHPGQSLEVLVLHRGEPIAAHVQATYDGFFEKPDTFFETADSGTNGTATLKITVPGLWLIRVEYAVPEVTEAYQRWVGRATLLLSIR